MDLLDEYTTSEKEIFYNASKGDLSVVIHLLQKMTPSRKKSLACLEDDKGNTLLHWACFRSNLELVVHLLENGGEPNKPNKKYMKTPFHLACLAGDIGIVYTILDYYQEKHHAFVGQHRELEEERGESPLDTLLSAKDSMGRDCLYFSIYSDNALLVHFLTLKGANVHTIDNEGNVCLHHAVLRGSEAMVNLLISNGANIDSQNKEGNTPLHVAAINDNISIFKILLRHGASHALKNNMDVVPSEMALLSSPSPSSTSKSPTSTIPEFYDMAKAKPHLYFKRSKFSTEAITKWAITGCLLYFSFLITLCQFGFFVGFVYLLLAAYLIRTVGRHPSGEEQSSLFPAIVISVWLSMFYIWADRMLPIQDNPLENVMYAVLNITAFVMYLVVLLGYSDPGVIKITPQEDSIGFFDDIAMARGPISICSNDRVRRPLRSKHCRNVDKCVARFDHYCPWLCNAVGLRNHKPFIAMIFLFCVSFYWYFRFFFIYSTAKGLGQLMEDTLMVYLTIQGVGFCCWLTHQLSQQVMLISANVTLNEKVNKERYHYFWENNEYRNPFDQGSYWMNLIDFLYPKTDWMTLYYLDSPPVVVITV